MLRTLLISIFGPALLSAQLFVDFNRSSANDLEAGYQAYSAAHESSESFSTQNFSAFGTTVSVTPDWPDTSDNRVEQMIDRGVNNDANWNGGKISLLTDFIGVDTRVNNGGNGNYDGSNGSPTRMTLALSNLPGGSYSWRSYHHDTENIHTSFTIEYSTNSGTSYTPVGIIFQGTNSSSGGNPASTQTYTGSPNPDPLNLPSTAEFFFTAKEGQDVTIRFTPLSNTGVHRQIWAMNGFEIEENTAPSIENVAATIILGTTATIGGNVTGGGAPEVTLYWGPSDGGTTALSWANSVSLGTQNGTFNSALSSLAEETTYYYRAFATNSAGSVWAAQSRNFTTTSGATAPSLVTAGATNVTFTQADLNGVVTDTGGSPPEVTFFYGKTDGGTNPNNWDSNTTLSAQSGLFTTSLINLDPDTSYFFRVQGTNVGGTTWASNTQTFTTQAFTTPEVVTKTPLFVGGTTATLVGEVTDTGNDPPVITIFYGMTDGGEDIELWDASIELGAQSNVFTAPVGDLAGSTDYFYRVRGVNSVATVWSPMTQAFSTGIPSDIVINEFMASNDTTLIPNGVINTFQDWIELLNTGTQPIDLGGWHLTDSLGDPNKWTFPAGTNLEVGEFLVILANGSGVPDVNGNLTVNFKLSASGDYLALVRPNLSVASEFGPGGMPYPEQSEDISYGRHPSSNAEVYFTNPTPGAPNDAGGVARVLPLSVSPERGYYEAAQRVTISSPTSGAQIYYTIDGSSPLTSAGEPSATAQLYGGPFQATQTLVLRAAAILSNYHPSVVETRTFFLLDISGADANGTDAGGLNQSFLTQGQPSGYANLASGDYDMDPEVSQSTAASTGHAGQTVAQAMLAGMRDIPTISIALPKDDFAGTNGIYTNPQSEGIAWERACSAEFIPAAGDSRKNFQIDCGLRVQGGASRLPAKSPKHSLSFRFREQYGEGRLRQPLFPGSEVTEFNSIALRAGYNNSWIHSSAAQRTAGSMIRDQWMRESMRDMGHADAGEGFLAHVFVNGLYWGLHNVTERQDNVHYAQYHDAADDLVTARNGTKYVNGTSASWNQMRSTVAAGNWDDIQEVLDVDAYIDYHLLQRFGANQDLKTSGNWRAAGGGPFTTASDMLPWKLYSWDGERVLESPTAINVPLDPMNIRNNIEALPEYRIRFADRAQMHLTGDGALTPAKTEARWMKHAAMLDKAVIAESARWGDHRRAIPYDRDNWLTEQTRLRNSYFPIRTTNVINKLKADNLYSDVDLPIWTVDGQPSEGEYLAPGSVLSVKSGDGTIYYTLDGSDPALPDGNPNPNALNFSSGVVPVNFFNLESAGWKYLNDPAQPQSDSEVVVGNGAYDVSDWKHPDFDDSGWVGAVGLIGGISANSITGHPTNTIIDIGGVGDRYPTVYLRKAFTVTNASEMTELNFGLVRDDGAIVYLNGREIFRSNMDPGNYSYADFAPQAVPNESAVIPYQYFPVAGELLEGENVIAIEIHNNSNNSSDLGADLQLSGMKSIAGGGSQIILSESSLVTARLLAGSDWSAPTQAAFLLEELAAADNLAITEINYQPAEATLLEHHAGAIDLSDRDQMEFIELTNIGDADLNLSGAQFIAGLQVQFGLEKVAPGERVVLVKNPEALEARYGSPLPFRVVGTYTQSLDNSGEQLTLNSSSGELIKSLSYDDGFSWPSRPDGDGSSLSIIDPAGDPNDPDNWRSSSAYNGSPGTSPLQLGPNIVINEVSTNGGDFIELHNPSTHEIDLYGWLLSDSKSTYASYRFPAISIPAMGYITIPASAYESPVENVIENYEGTLGFSPATVVSPGHGLATGDLISISGYDGIADYNGTFEVSVVDTDRFSIPEIFLDNIDTKGIWVHGRSFGLSGANGDDLWLLKTDINGLPVAFIDHVEFAAARENETLGRWPDGGGSETLITMVSPSPAIENTGPLLGPVFISEVHFSATAALQFVELCNETESVIPLNNWRLRGGLDFNFKDTHAIPAKGAVVIVSFNPDTEVSLVDQFRDAYRIDSSVILIGPATDGPLNAQSGTVRLQSPGIPTQANPADFPQITVDSVDYQSDPPWPNEAGESLHRNVMLTFGNFSTSWNGEVPTPGNQLGVQSYVDFAQINGIGDEQEDADGDGVPNLLEFATGSDPTAFTNYPLTFTGDSALLFTLNLQAQGVQLSLQGSSDLQSWTTIPTQEGERAGSLQIRRIRMSPEIQSKRFLRLIAKSL